jgi:Kef-type K+ transport system membrane component KefB
VQSLIAEPFTRLIAQVVVIVALSRLIGLGARRFGQPMVIAELVAGILLGPSLLGWLLPDVSRALFASDSLPSLGLVSQVGLVLFMFLIGLELDPRLLRERGHAPLVISQATFLVPLLLGVLLALYLYPRWAGSEVTRATFAIFVGAAMSSTAFPVLARIVAERNLVRSRLGTLALACAAIDDVIAWCLLAFVVASVRATGLTAAAATSGLAILYIAAMFLVVRPLLARLARRVGRGVLSNDRVAAVMLLLFASSWATELIGIHALFGAFLFGAIMPRDGGLAHALSEKLGDIVIVVLLPLFFAYSGVRTQIGLLDSTQAWMTCGLIVLVACAGKLGAGTLAARLTGLSWRESGAVGALMNTRGLMVLIVLNLGLDFEIIDPALFSMFVVMALVTTFAAKPLLDAVYPMGQHIRDLLVRERAGAQGRTRPDEGYRVLACVQSQGSAAGLYALARALSGASEHARVHALALRAPDAAADEPGLTPTESSDIRLMSFPSSDPARDICRMAEVKAADIVLLGRVLRGGSGLLGSTAGRVVAECIRSVGVLVGSGDLELREVLFVQSGGPHDAAARTIADRLLAAGSRVTEGGRDAPFALLELRAFDLVVTGLPDDRDADELVRGWRAHGCGEALLVVRGVRGEVEG